jgi:3-hydroxymyristoyl/3-hydroxydecanoyl-(acyl carrier protein) dehydratase
MPQLSGATLVDTTDLAFEQTVPRSLVHKRRLENVLLTDIRSCGDDRFLCAGHLPIAHRFFNEPGRSPRRDILFYTELGRQASLAVSHAFLGVSTDDVFIFEQSEARVADAAWKPTSAAALEPALVEIRIHELTRRRNNAVNRVVAEHIMTIGGEEVFRGTGAWTVQPAALFQRLRRMSAPRIAPTAPSNVAPFPAPVHVDGWRTSAEHVVITTPEYSADNGAFAATLIVNESHPYFFDHPCDHVPGMLLLEACAQLAMAAARVTLTGPIPLGITSYEVNFAQFVECGIPTTLSARADGDRTVQVTISQQQVLSGTTTLTLAFPA